MTRSRILSAERVRQLARRALAIAQRGSRASDFRPRRGRGALALDGWRNGFVRSPTVLDPNLGCGPWSAA
jgi:hypothetical protein